MKKSAVIFVAISLMISMTGCGTPNNKISSDIISSSGIITQSSSSQVADFVPEKPDANDILEINPSSSSEALKPSSSSEMVLVPNAGEKKSSEAPKPSSSEAAQSPSLSADINENQSDEVQTSPAKEQVLFTQTDNVQTSNNASANIKETDEVRAVWISYLEFDTMLKGKTKAQFESTISKAFKNIKNFDMNTVFVQVRPYGDAYYDSSYFPWSAKITGTEGKDPGFDPLEIMVKLAHENGLRIEAWINPYRVRTDTNVPLSSGNQAKKWLNAGHDGAIKYKNGIYYNPGNKDARKLIVNGVSEIVENYDIDGIHFDDYFYPTTDAAFDKNTYTAYKNAGGKLELADWRRENVNILVREVYAEIKALDKDVVFGISPQGNMSNNYNAQFIDVKKWLSNEGYIDYICPQVYYGFKNSGSPFASTVKAFNDMIKVDGIALYVGLAPYKLGTEDSWAGDGKTEWKSTTDIMKRMVLNSRDNSRYGGFVMYRYDSLFNPSSGVKAQVDKEKQNLKGILD